MSRDSNQLANQIAPETEQATVRAVREPYPTIWEVPDAVWEKLFLPLLSEFDPPSPMGRPRVDPRPCLNGMIYRARTGCQWNHLPQEFGSDSTVHRTVYRWDQKGIFDRLWALLIYHCEDLNAVHWEWQSADGCLSKARFIGKKGAVQKQLSPKVPKTLKAPKTLKVPKAKASVQTPRTVASWASSKAYLLKQEADLWLSASQGPT
jgi:transposase